MQVNCEELNKLKVKNFPQTFSSEDKKKFMINFGAINVVTGRDFVIAQFKDEAESTQFLKIFHQKQILERRLKVEYFTKELNTVSEVTPEPAKESPCNNINEFLLKWLAINSNLDFNQPPPPYLKYKYPKPSREIIDSICVALESVPKFCTQVLHLMNRMNLPPPFNARDVQKTKQEPKYESVSCQTEISNVRGKKRKILSGDELLSDESELETDDDEEVKARVTPDVGVKRTKKTLISQNPAKRFLQQQNYPKSVKKDVINEPALIFETNVPIQNRKIALHVPNELTHVESLPVYETQATTPVLHQKVDESKSISREDLATNRLTPEQLSILPVFKNYQPGEKSNKLYIKNLSKTVTSDDLRMIFGHFIKKSSDELEVKLMQSGRMKGQAFVTFNTPYDDEDGDERMIDKALRETNGYLLKDKPMVVMYGKVNK